MSSVSISRFGEDDRVIEIGSEYTGSCVGVLDKHVDGCTYLVNWDEYGVWGLLGMAV